MDTSKKVVCGKISGSIENFREKLEKKFPPGGLWEDTIFFGLYRPSDYARFLIHRGRKAVFWCGADITRLGSLRARLVRGYKNYCENEVEAIILRGLGISPTVHPMIFDDENNFAEDFVPSRTPHVFMNVHPGRKEEYGLDIIEEIALYLPEVTFHIYGAKRGFHEMWFDATGIHNINYVGHKNIVYHGYVPGWQFDSEIRNYQASIRLNKIDGASEVMTKSLLLGQYPITAISYPHVDICRNHNELIQLLRQLKHKKISNPWSEWWRKKLQEPLTT